MNMKAFFTVTLVLVVGFLFAQEPITNYSYKFKVANLSDSTDSVVYMANYYGKKQYYFDTATIDKSGAFEFSGDTIVGGIYSIILSDKKSYFEFVVNEPKLEMSTVAGNFVPSMKIAESVENQKFYEYLNFIESKSGRAQVLKKKLESAEGKENEKLQEQLLEVDKEVIAYKTKFIEENPELLVSKVFKASAEPYVPEYKDILDEEERQRVRYREFKSQYLSDVDFTDERLLRTPVFHNKLSYYMSKLVPQVPDSVIKEADLLVERTDGNKEMYKYVVHFITSSFEDSKIMGMDAVLVHMGQNYYCPDKAWWLSKKKLEEFCERVEKMAPILIGKQAPNLILKDTADQWQDLYKINAPYTILYFWDSGCGHCKKVTPKLKDLYLEYKDKGVAVYAVGTEFENKDWKKYIIKNDLPFINVSDNPEINENAHALIRNGETTLESLNFRDTYDIFSTPKVFLLDENKKIIATKLMPEQLGEFLDRKLNDGEGEGSGKDSK
jgi:thiol-disulfide isomerase/thioredoxin